MSGIGQGAKTEGYFHRVSREFATRLWINNPTRQEARLAMEAGAISCTTNPTFAARMIREEEAEYVSRIVADSVRRFDDDAEAAESVQMELVREILSLFLPIHEETHGRNGFVSIQGNPHVDGDSARIVQEALEYRALGENFIAKIPVTQAGLKAMEILVAEDVPMIATEVMSVSQALRTCEAYERVSAKCRKAPSLFITHITGIFDEYLGNLAAAEGIPVQKESLRVAGCIVARKEYKMLRDRNYPVIMLGGGARGPHHFTELVGGEVHVTLNWKGMVDQLVETNPPVVSRIDATMPEHVVEELLRCLPDFRKAYGEDQLTVEEFEDFGPVRYFRSSFVKGWDTLSGVIAQQRTEQRSPRNR